MLGLDTSPWLSISFCKYSGCHFCFNLNIIQCYERMKRNLADLRSQFEQVLHDPNFHLSPEVSELCEEVPPDNLFCVIVGDCRLSVAETLITNSHIVSWDVERDSKKTWGMKLQKFVQNQAAANRIDVAVKAAEYAKQCGAEGPDFTYEAIKQSDETTNRLQCLFSNAEKNEIEECLAVGLSVNLTGDFETGLAELQRGRALLAGSTNWELYIQLSNSMAEIYSQRGNYEETVEVCRLILNAWTPSAHSLEFLRSLFYLIDSHFSLQQYAQGIALGEEWTGRLIADCSRCQCVLLCTEGIIFYISKRLEEAAKRIEKGLELDSTPCLITIYSKQSLTEIYQKQGLLDKSENTCRSACDLYFTHFPHSCQYAQCLIKLGRIYTDMKRPMKAEEQMVKAVELYSTHFPQSGKYADSLINLGVLYGDMERYVEAEEQLLKAIHLCSIHSPQSKKYADCLMNLGVLYGNSGRNEEAVKKLEEARRIYARIGSQWDIDKCDSNLRLFRIS